MIRIGSRVMLNRPGYFSGIDHPRGVVLKILTRFDRGPAARVKYDHGPVINHKICYLTEDKFPWRWHRTMAQVIADEQKPEPA